MNEKFVVAVQGREIGLSREFKLLARDRKEYSQEPVLILDCIGSAIGEYERQCRQHGENNVLILEVVEVEAVRNTVPCGKWRTELKGSVKPKTRKPKKVAVAFKAENVPALLAASAGLAKPEEPQTEAPTETESPAKSS